MIKTYLAEKNGWDPSKIVSVSLMPCTAKKFEAARPEMDASGYRDINYAPCNAGNRQNVQGGGLDFSNLEEIAVRQSVWRVQRLRRHLRC